MIDGYSPLRAPFGDFTYDPKKKMLYGYSETFGGAFPRSFEIRSPHTGNVILFVAVDHTHPLYDQDGWDGEAQVYVPHGDVPKNVEILMLSHAY